MKTNILTGITISLLLLTLPALASDSVNTSDSSSVSDSANLSSSSNVSGISNASDSQVELNSTLSSLEMQMETEP